MAGEFKGNLCTTLWVKWMAWFETSGSLSCCELWTRHYLKWVLNRWWYSIAAMVKKPILNGIAQSHMVRWLYYSLANWAQGESQPQPKYSKLAVNWHHELPEQKTNTGNDALHLKTYFGFSLYLFQCICGKSSARNFHTKFSVNKTVCMYVWMVFLQSCLWMLFRHDWDLRLHVIASRKLYDNQCMSIVLHWSIRLGWASVCIN